MNLPYFIYYVGGPRWKCVQLHLVLLSSSMITQKRITVKDQSSGDEGIASYIPTIAAVRYFDILFYTAL